MAGQCLRVPVRVFQDSMKRDPDLTELVHRYLAYSLRSSGQTIACNAFHSIEARTCRWLLMLHHQSGRNALPMTQGFLAYMPGVGVPLSRTCPERRNVGRLTWHLPSNSHDDSV